MRSARFLAYLSLVLLGLSAGRLHAATVTLAWDAASGAAHYGVLVGSTAGQYTSEYDAGLSTSFTLPDLLPGRAYYFSVRSYTSAGVPSSASNEVYYVTPQTPPANYTSAMVWQNQATGWLTAWYMNGRSLLVSSYLSPNLVSDPTWKISATGDFNGDGQKDLLWRQQGSGLLVVWFMNGLYQQATSFTTPNSVPDMTWVIEATGDLNGDGRADVLWRNRGTGQMLAWMMNGATRTAAVYLNPDRVADTQWHVAGIADFNNDGRGDLLWRSASGSLYVWFMNGTTKLSGTYLTPSYIDPSWDIATIGDLNDDGRADIIWRHSGQGLMTAWYFNGTTLSSSAYLTPSQVSDMNWSIRGVF